MEDVHNTISYCKRFTRLNCEEIWKLRVYAPNNIHAVCYSINCEDFVRKFGSCTQYNDILCYKLLWGLYLFVWRFGRCTHIIIFCEDFTCLWGNLEHARIHCIILNCEDFVCMWGNLKAVYVSWCVIMIDIINCEDFTSLWETCDLEGVFTIL